MEANKDFTGCKNTAVAPGCFDLPYAQAVDLCNTCHGEKQIFHLLSPTGRGMANCPDCEGLGFIAARMITNWKFTEQEWQYMVDNPEKRGVFLSITGTQHPKTLITVENPIDIWQDVVPVDSEIAQDLLKKATANAG